MLILHASIVNKEILLWGERSVQEKPQRKGATKKKQLAHKEHPFSASSEQLKEALKPFGFIFKNEAEQFLAWLPSSDDSPVPSNPILSDGFSLIEEGGLQPWVVKGMFLSFQQFLDLLFLCEGKEILAQGILCGKELIFLFQVIRFSLSLVLQQRYLPAIEEREGVYQASWSPVFLGKDKERFSLFVRSCPGICRALSMAMKQSKPPEVSAEVILRDYIDSVVNETIRNAQRDAPLPKQSKAIHDQWLFHLGSSDGTLAVNDLDCQRLFHQVNEWKRPLVTALTSPFRLCFRLEEPPKDKFSAKSDPHVSAWFIRYLLQAHDDPSLMVEIKDVWNPKGAKRKVLERDGFHSRQYALSALGVASGLCTQVELSLKDPSPAGYEVDIKGAYQFLSEKAAVFEEAGYGVILPSWWTGRKTKQLVAKAHVKSSPLKSTSGKSLWDMVKVDWEIAMGDHPLSLDELQALAKLKEPLVQMRGEWVHLNQDEIQRAISFWQKRDKQKMSLHEITHMSLGFETEEKVFIEGVEATGWVHDFLQKFHGNNALEDLPLPISFQGSLRPYQMRGFSWITFLKRWGLGACLADDMGLGKTPQTLASILHDRDNGLLKPVLLICPTSLTGNWSREATKFAPSLTCMVHHGSTRVKGDSFKKSVENQSLVISSYSLLQRDIELFKKVEWAGVILDEAQNIKNAQTKQSQAAFALKSDYRIALTGTPVENNVGDLWALMNFLNPGLLSSQTEFKKAFFQPIQGSERSQEATEKLKRLTRPFILRRLKTDKSIISDLPAKMEMKVFCTLTKEQASLYEVVVEDASGAIAKSEGIKRKGIILSTLVKLKQICNHPAQFLKDNSKIEQRSGKVDRLIEMLQETLQIGESSLIFTQFSEMGEILKKHLQEVLGNEVLFLHGGVSKKHRDLMVERFQQEDGPKIFILSLKAGGTGLNLTKANHVFHIDRWWNPAVENQATDRAYRIGQKKNVQVHKFLCAGTLEERIDEMIEKKKQVAENVVGTGEGWLTELSTAELKDLFKLRKEGL